MSTHHLAEEDMTRERAGSSFADNFHLLAQAAEMLCERPHPQQAAMTAAMVMSSPVFPTFAPTPRSISPVELLAASASTHGVSFVSEATSSAHTQAGATPAYGGAWLSAPVLPVRELSDQSAHAVHSLMTTPNPKLALSQLRRGRPEPPSLPPPVNASNAALLLSLQPSFQYMPPRADAMRDAHARVALATGAAPRPPCAAAARARDATAAAADGAEDDDEECEGALDWSPSECERAKKRPHQRRTAPWTRTEDEVISEAVNQFGCRWGILAALLPGRTCASVRNRWHRLKSARKLREGSAAEPAADGELDDDDSDGAADDDDASHALAPPVAPPRAAPAVAPAAAPASPIAPGFALPMTTPVAGASRRLASRSGFVGCGYKCSRCGQPKRGHLCTGVRDETDQAAYDAAQQRMRSLVWQQEAIRGVHADARPLKQLKP